MNDSKCEQIVSVSRTCFIGSSSSGSDDQIVNGRYGGHFKFNRLPKKTAAFISVVFTILFLSDDVVASSPTLSSISKTSPLGLLARQESQYHQSIRSISMRSTSSMETGIKRNTPISATLLERKQQQNTSSGSNSNVSMKTMHLDTKNSNNSNSNDIETRNNPSQRSLIRKKQSIRKKRKMKENTGKDNKLNQNKKARNVPNNNNKNNKNNKNNNNNNNNNGVNGGQGNNKKTNLPSIAPSNKPSVSPTMTPIKSSSKKPTGNPSPFPSMIPSSALTESPSKLPTFFPTTSTPTIMKGNPTPSPTRWEKSFVDEEGLVLTLSTLTADEDQIEFVKRSDNTRRNQSIRETKPDDSNVAKDRVMKRIYKEDILNGNEVDLVKAVVSTMADVLCKYTDLVIIYKSENNDGNANTQYSDYCVGDSNPILNINSYYSNRDTVILVPADGKDLFKIKLKDFQVFEQSIKGNYLHWIQWSISCPIMRISKLALNQKEQNVDEALELIKKETRLVMDTTTSSHEVRDILMSKSQYVLSAAANGWEVVESIDFIEAKKAVGDNDDSFNNSTKDSIIDPIDGKRTDSGLIGFFQPIRIVGLVIMIFFVTILMHLIRAGRRRDEKIWEAKKAIPMRGDLVSYEGVNYMLQSSQMNPQNMNVSQQSAGHSSSSEENDFSKSPNKEKEEFTRLVSKDIS